MLRYLNLFAVVSIVLIAAIFGFFFAWVCSTLWGLDSLSAVVAIEAMNEMNASVRNAVFAPAFFGTPIGLSFVAAIAFVNSERSAGRFFATAALVYLLGAFLPTVTVSVPMNQGLAQVSLSQPIEQLEVIWQDYSTRWQFWNLFRTLASGIALIISLIGFKRLGAQA